ncbi:hypothetical protein [Dyadobacter sp. 32]|uniref:hypothetical protein n=1 Tax=Dyadobacter sp. 32 TaxID=538966 RepID=UPI0039C63AC7
MPLAVHKSLNSPVKTQARGSGSRISPYALIDENKLTGKFFSEESNPETGEIAW